MPARKMNQQAVLRGLAAATLLGMPLIAWLIARFNDDINLMDRWTGNWPIHKQLLLGLPAGLLAGFAARFVISLPFMKQERLRYAKMLGSFELNWSEILFVSLCAGVGEELLFRGVLQPIFGIIITAVFFVVIHGYLNPRNWRISIYGIFMTFVVIGFGVMTEVAGIWSAAFAHFLVDVILFSDLGVNASKGAQPDDALSDGEEIDPSHNEVEDQSEPEQNNGEKAQKE